ncbi:hypothetical protein CKW39_01465 [Kocuria sp. WRN011]|uniref:DUF3618 domain-containing protein n=1 Tax=Kocuria TaxID=57493 RepID=UPI000BB0B2CF|nr:MULTISPECIES: DUF3618 domain-containing protein [Kocuria]MCT1803289.1 DUF3618 domain-containing protein [Kocuria carniphila]PBB09770.1 hypothetical protein CKW39_01465 [Kocuria sp. WRN011]
MSQQNPEEIRAEIEATRARLSADVDAVTEKVTPENVVDRQKNKARNKIQGVRESIMGSADDARVAGHHAAHDLRDEASYRMDQAGNAVSNAPAAAKAKTRGNPLAAGLIALGAGWLVGSLLPSSKKEQELVADAADRVQPHVQSAVDSTKEAAQDIAQDLKEPAKEAAQSVKETAQSGAEEVKSQGQREADQLKGSAQNSAKNVKDNTQQA